MADIIQLKENGVTKYLQTHVDAVEGLMEKTVQKTGDETISGTKNFRDALQMDGQMVIVGDTGWKNVTAGPNFSWSLPVQVRRVGKTVRFRGSIKSTTNTEVFCVLPEEFRPGKIGDGYELQFDVATQSSTLSNKARIYVRSNGEMVLIASTGLGNIFLSGITYFVG